MRLELLYRLSGQVKLQHPPRLSPESKKYGIFQLGVLACSEKPWRLAQRVPVRAGLRLRSQIRTSL